MGESEVLCNTEVREILGLEPQGVEEVQIMTFGSESTTLDDYNCSIAQDWKSHSRAVLHCAIHL